MSNNVVTLRKNQFLIFMCISALLLGGCKRHANKTTILDIDTVQVKEVRISGRDHDHVYILTQNKHGRTYEAWGWGHNHMIGGAQRGDWLVIDANPENHPFGEPNLTFNVYENLTTGHVDYWYGKHLRQGIRNGQDSIAIINKFGRPVHTYVIHRQK